MVCYLSSSTYTMTDFLLGRFLRIERKSTLPLLPTNLEPVRDLPEELLDLGATDLLLPISELPNRLEVFILRTLLERAEISDEFVIGRSELQELYGYLDFRGSLEHLEEIGWITRRDEERKDGSATYWYSITDLGRCAIKAINLVYLVSGAP